MISFGDLGNALAKAVTTVNLTNCDQSQADSGCNLDGLILRSEI